MKACIEMTLELLTKPFSDKIKSLILWNGIGTSLQKAVLSYLWNISKQEAEETIDVLWSYGLVQFTDITTSPNNITQRCVEVHAVISQYIIECMDSNEAYNLSPDIGLSTGSSVSEGLILLFQHLYGAFDSSSQTAVGYLEYKRSEIENFLLPYFLKTINMSTVTDPHHIIVLLQYIHEDAMTSSNTMNLQVLGEEVNSLVANCKLILRDTHKLCRKLNQNIERNLCEKDYDKLIRTVEEFITNYPLCSVAETSIVMVKKIIPYFDGELLQCMIMNCEHLQMLTYDYHIITTSVLPYIKLFIKHHKQIISALLNGSPDIELTYNYLISNQVDEEYELVKTIRLIKLQEVAPNIVNKRVSQH